MANLNPFHIDIPQADLDDLRARLKAARFPTPELVKDASQGVQLATLKALADAEVAKYPGCAGDARIAVPINDPKIYWATYRVGQYPASFFTSQASARNVVRTERRLELAMEGQRFFDLRRYGTAIQTLNDFMTVEKVRFPNPLAGSEPLTSRHLRYPIPQNQIDLSKVGATPQLKQNPGW